MAQRYERLQAKLADAIEVMQIEADALREAQLYWVSRDMVDQRRHELLVDFVFSASRHPAMKSDRRTSLF